MDDFRIATGSSVASSCPVQGRAVWSSAVAVMTLSVLARLGACHESFWVDELHTAWCIWADFAEVAARARAGNQTPFYFQALWFWKLFAGESEFALRLSSVLATTLACGISVFGVARITASLTAGGIAGLLMAIDTNAIFFGTELRPYAWVLLFTVVLLDAATRQLRPLLSPDELKQNGPSETPEPSGSTTGSRLVGIAAFCGATLVHPTAVATLGIFSVFVAVPILAQNRNRPSHLSSRSPTTTIERRRGRMLLPVGLAIGMVALTGLALWMSPLGESWTHRDRWRAFASARSYHQLWTVWPWVALVILPMTVALSVAIAGRVIGRMQPESRRARRRHPWTRAPDRRESTDRNWAYAYAGILLATALLSTGCFFVAAWVDVVPLWHRRYFIAVLPILIWFAGITSGLQLQRLAEALSPGRGSVVLMTGAAVTIGGLVTSEGLLRPLASWPPAFAKRGEDWRGAVDWIHTEAGPRDFILLDSGLIEANPIRDARDLEEVIDISCSPYLQFPLSGPYSTGREDCTDNQLIFAPGMRPSAAGFVFVNDSETDEVVWIITRSPVAAWKPLLQKVAPESWDEATYRRYDRIAVLRLPVPRSPALRSRRGSGNPRPAGAPLPNRPPLKRASRESNRAETNDPA